MGFTFNLEVSLSQYCGYFWQQLWLSQEVNQNPMEFEARAILA